MTDQGDPLTRRHGYASRPVTRRGNKLAPDPDVRRAIVAAASKTVREQGVQGLSVAAVLDRAQLSTRAFYRHFESKNQLVAALFLEVTRDEVLRLRTKMAAASTPAAAVAAWIEGRLDLAFDENIDSEVRQVALEAQAAMSSTPELVSPAYNAILEPLIEQLQRGLELGVFRDILPATAAKSIHGVVWGHTHRQRATGQCARADVRNRALRFCLRGLGVAPDSITQIVAGGGA
ncbi:MULTISPECIES: TetR/AcrR family transcriptional regulator [unclassified Mycobacterium]|uniref:TetR/AcrR family transcriptional regulator n=1 Tax=unclassified Mycobacterium TaxID=2642494 RepID=UPI0009F86CC3|nr:MULTISPECIES: TetR/AcrR family transcriptional regulator [unclassified Mycobacterium]